MNDKVMQTNSTSNMADLQRANDQLYAGLNDLFKGDVEPLNKLWSHSETITYMGPFGGCLTGWKEVKEEFQKVAALKLGGSISSKDLKVYAETNLGYTSCVEEGENIGPDGKPVKVSHRATNIFHLEDGEWRLVHHHTDISSQLEVAYDMELK
ncbi:MAG: nuclear transport factor 2 family protein [Bacteroidia bacterium]